MLELKDFENGLVDLVKDIKFENRPNPFQQKLKKDVTEIRQESRVHVAGDKSTNFHKMSPRKYNEFLDKSIQMEYKKANPQAARDIRTSHQKMVEDLELQNRVFTNTIKAACRVLARFYRQLFCVTDAKLTL